jgi:hypothetical protein
MLAIANLFECIFKATTASSTVAYQQQYQGAAKINNIKVTQPIFIQRLASE